MDPEKPLDESKLDEVVVQDKFAWELTSAPTNAKNVWEAAIRGDIETMSKALADGWDVRKHHDKAFGGTALHYAAWNARYDMVKLLINHVKETYGKKS